MKILCIGRNYSEHAKELKNEIPTEPVVFMKPATAITRNHKVLFYPEFTKNLHYEGELVIKISKNGKKIEEKFARKIFEEITVGIDFTARDLQNKIKREGLPWEIAKAFDGSAVVGDFVSFKDLKDRDNIHFTLKKNGELVQDGYSKDMLFTFEKLVSYVSNYFTLLKGDLIFTGTPAGVGPTQIDDAFEGYLEDEKVMGCKVK